MTSAMVKDHVMQFVLHACGKFVLHIMEKDRDGFFDDENNYELQKYL